MRQQSLIPAGLGPHGTSKAAQQQQWWHVATSGVHGLGEKARGASHVRHPAGARRAIALTDIRVPLFAVGTETDHVAPWRSVDKFHLLADMDVTFLLANGGHNGGIVSEPGHKGRRYRIRTKRESDRFVDPETWIRDTPAHEGSWWPAWVEWLSRQSGKRVTPPVVGAAAKGLVALADAPGTYILQR